MCAQRPAYNADLKCKSQQRVSQGHAIVVFTPSVYRAQNAVFPYKVTLCPGCVCVCVQRFRLLVQIICEKCRLVCKRSETFLDDFHSLS